MLVCARGGEGVCMIYSWRQEERDMDWASLIWKPNWIREPGLSPGRALANTAAPLLCRAFHLKGLEAVQILINI